MWAPPSIPRAVVHDITEVAEKACHFIPVLTGGLLPP
jgi:hypothetical protein